MTGLRQGQLTELAARVEAAIGDVVKPGGAPAVTGLYKSVAMVVALMRTNITQEIAGDIFGCSQATVSRRWDLLRPAIGQVLASCVPDPRQILRGGTALVDGTIAPTWDWNAIPDLFSGKAGYPGMNLQIAATLGGQVAAIGPVPVHGARHDAHAFEASGLKALLSGLPAAADLGYLGVQGIAIVPFRTPRGGRLHDSQAAFNKDLSGIRAAAERAVASVKTWRMLSGEGGRYRAPISKYAEMLTAVTGLFFFSNYYDPYE
ncbi:MAG TPA: transposase family protein [Streptosporangiaceae bacterium]|jgi:hypothetical protein